MQPSKFESLCRVVLEAEGCQNVHVTSLSGDAGVDFIGTRTVHPTDYVQPNVFRDMEILVMGRAKRYKDEVGIHEIRNFLSSLSLMKVANLPSKPNFFQFPVSQDSYKPFSPVLLIFMASSEAGRNTHDFAKWLGIRFIGGEELITILFTHDVGFISNGTTIEFSADTVRGL